MIRNNYIFIDKEDYTNPFYLTEIGLFPQSMVKEVGNLLITPKRVLRCNNWIKYESFKDMSSKKGVCVDYVYDKSGSGGLTVGYDHYIYKFPFGMLTISKGDWMDDGCYFEVNGITTVIRC